MHNIHYETAPASLLNLWPKNVDRNQNYNLRNNNDYQIPRANYNFYTRSPAYSFTTLWNESNLVTPHRNPITFKIAVKHMLLNDDPIPILTPPPPPPHPPPPPLPPIPTP